MVCPMPFYSQLLVHIKWLALLLVVPLISNCSQSPVLADSRGENISSRDTFMAAGQGAQGVAEPLVKNVETPKTGQLDIALQPVTRPPVKAGFSFDQQLRQIAQAENPQLRAQLVREYLMQAWNLGPKKFEKAKARLGQQQYGAQ